MNAKYLFVLAALLLVVTVGCTSAPADTTESDQAREQTAQEPAAVIDQSVVDETDTVELGELI